MLNKKEINEKKKYIINRLKNNVSELEEEKLRTTLAVFLELELRNDNLKNMKLYNFVSKISGYYNLIKDNRKIVNISKKVINPFKIELDKDYIEFLIDLANNISKITIDYYLDDLKKLNIKDEEVINLSKEFYKKLGNEKIYEKAIKIIDDSTHYGFTDTVSLGKEDEYGVTCYDLVFTKPYISVKRTNDLMQYQAFNHEVMHGVDFYTSPSIPSKIYYGFHEFPPYTIDYLFIDFLEEKGFDLEQVNILKYKKLTYVLSLANNIKTYIDSSISNNGKYIVNWHLIKDMLELESCVLSKAMYEQVKDNKEYGLNNLVKFMENPLPKGIKPDFSFIDISDNVLLYFSNNL